MKDECASGFDPEVAGTIPARRLPSAFDDRSSSSTLHPSSFRLHPSSLLVYLLLLAMAVAAFAPCVLLPEWRQLQALRLVEAAELARVADMEVLLARERRLIEAMTTDPAVVARLAQRELGYRRADERAIPIAGDAITSAPATRSLLAESGKTIQPLAICWPGLEFDRVFCNDRTRPIIMGMSVALAGGAFLLFGMRKGSDPESENPLL
jgi:hypothetical protein